MADPGGPSVDSELRWDTASAFTINLETPWDTLRAHVLWAIWGQRLAHAFNDESFHLGLVLWYAWRNTIYAAMEAYKELHRHKRNEEKRQEQIACFEQIWMKANLFGRMQHGDLKWHLTPPHKFLPQDVLGCLLLVFAHSTRWLRRGGPLRPLSLPVALAGMGSPFFGVVLCFHFKPR